MNRVTRAVCGALLCLSLVGATWSAPPVGGTAVTVTAIYFPQTGHALGYHFKVYWERQGGVRAFGYPLSEEFAEGGRATQYFERAVLQYFPEFAGGPFEVQLAQLGREVLAGRETEPALRPVAPFAPAADRYFFPETGHGVSGRFLAAWSTGGGLAVYGYPLSEEFQEVSPTDGKPYRVQYFERNRFEHHPEYAGSRDELLLGLLGTQRTARLGLFSGVAFQPQPAPPGVARVVSRAPASRPLVALTFDAGADRGLAAQILDILAASNVKATFGVTGQWARAHPDLVRRMAAEGHQVINHTDSHRSFTGLSDRTGGLSPDERVAELDRADAAIAPLIGRSTRPWFRSPFGDYDAATLEQLAATGYTYNILWTVDSLGWNGLPTGAIVRRVLDGATPGAILLFHVGAASADAAALPAIIEGLRAQGYGFATVEQLLAP